jgi:ubiquinone/menaquinone biosynthesis C-methylase UbiE
MSTNTRPGYWLGTGRAEVEHLVAQADVCAPEADELLDRIALRSGASAIDVGCGVLGVLPQLRARVGPRGRVVGLDLEPRLLGIARELLEARGVEAKTVQGDAAATGLPYASFDLVHARALLINVTAPAATVAEMVRLARPGGVVAVEEPDPAGWLCDPPHPAFDRLRERVIAVYPRAGKDFELGRRAARLLRDAGLADVQVRASPQITHPGDFFHTFLLTLVVLMREPLLAAPDLSAEQLDDDVAALAAHLDDPYTITCRPLLWQAWGTKR